MRTPSDPGCGELFEEYFDSGIPGYLLTTGVHDGAQYKIYRRYKRDPANDKASHYTVYVKINKTPCNHILERRHLPPTPVHHNKNFGPTEDHWIGFGTLDGRDHNYYENGNPFESDHRLLKDELFHNDSISKWTPNKLETETQNWIEDIHEFIEDKVGCRSCENADRQVTRTQ